MDRKRKILVIINDIHRAQEHEWFVRFINKEQFELEFALLNSEGSFMQKFLEENNITVHNFSYSGKKGLIFLIPKLIRLMRKGKYDVVHTHLFESSIAGLTAARIVGVKRRIMTRHYSDYHHVWFPSAVKYDRFINSLCTHIVAISENVKSILMDLEHQPASKIVLIHHGLVLDEFEKSNISQERVDKIRGKYELKSSQVVIGTISRFTELKGLQYIIPAFAKLLERRKDLVLVMANASGDYESRISELLSGLPVTSYRKIKFEEDIAALYQVFDCFIHVPINKTAEAFGQTYIEALAAGVPSVFTLSGVAPEFIVNGRNAMVVDYCNHDQIYEALADIILNNANTDNIVEQGYNDVKNNFNIGIKISRLEALYS